MTVHVLGGMGTVHTHTEKGTRTCARDGCDTEFVPRTADHRCCSRACRTARWKADRRYEDPRKAQRPSEASRNARKRVRKSRPPRVRPTLTLDEARAVVRGGNGRAKAIAKIAAALQREEARHG